MKVSFGLFALVASVAQFASAQDADIPATAVAAGGFDTLVAALGAADLVSALSAPAGPFTVFAPTDEAFGTLPDGLVSCLLLEENVGLLTDILLYHVASGSVASTDLSSGQVIPTLLADANVTVTLGFNVQINDSTVVTPDISTSNGIIHAIDSVLLPPGTDVAAFLETCPNGEDPIPDIPGVAVAAGTFETLVAALMAAELVDALSEPAGPFTVFAPTDDAFDALPAGLVDCLLGDIPTLQEILKYHVVNASAVTSDMLTDGQEIATLQGELVTVDLSDGVKINDATVSGPDVAASNGVIHVVDGVLVPPSIDANAFLEACTAPAVDATEAPDSETSEDSPVVEATEVPITDSSEDSASAAYSITLSAVAGGIVAALF